MSQNLTTEVLKYFEENKGPHTTAEIVDHVSCKDRNTLRALLNYLKNKGSMTSDGRGLWMLAKDEIEDDRAVLSSKYIDLSNAVLANKMYYPSLDKLIEKYKKFNTPGCKNILHILTSFDVLISRVDQGLL